VKLPRFLARTPPPRSAGIARADVSAVTDVGIAEFEAIAGLGRAIGRGADIASQAYQHRRDLDDIIESGKATQRVQESWNKVEEEVDNFNPQHDQPLPDDPNYLKTLTTFGTVERDQYLANQLEEVEKDATKIFSGIRSPKTKAKLISQYNELYADRVKSLKGELNKKLYDYQIDEMSKLAEAAALNGNIEISNFYVDKMAEHGLIKKTAATKLKKDYLALFKGIAIENIKPGLVTAIAVGTKEDAIKLLNVETSELWRDGTLTKAETAEANKKLGDWVDNFVSGRNKKIKDNKAAQTRQLYRDFSEPIVTSDLTFDEVDQSNMLKDDKEKWFKYIRGSYEDAPTENTPKGHTISFAAVYDAATLQLSPKEAYDVLLESRFADRSITDNQFKWGIDKIEDPYPKNTLENLNSIMKSNLGDFNRIFSFDNERNKNVNEQLIAWVDRQREDGKEPTKKEMYTISSQFRAGDDRWYDIGQIVERGGVRWEVIGFDDNGEPLVEEAR